MPQLLSNILLYAALFLLAIILVSALRRIVQAVILIRRDVVVLELTPPAFKDKRPDANRMLLQALHGYGQSRSLSERLLGLHSYISLEIVASKDKGIRYQLRCNENQYKNIDRIITTHMPEVIVTKINDPLHGISARISSITRFRQASHYMYPLVRYERDDTHDPIGYITGAMTKLESNEQFIYQVSISPRRFSASKKLRKKIVANENLIYEYHNRMPSLVGRFFGVV